MAEPAPDQMMTCPYNMAHQIQHSRMQFHLVKCRKQYPEAKKAVCPFDAKHIVNELELSYHIAECRKRAMLDKMQYKLDDEEKPKVDVEVTTQNFSTDNEDWDSNCATSYVPDLSKKANVLRKAKGLTPAERRKVRMEGVRAYGAAQSNLEN